MNIMQSVVSDQSWSFWEHLFDLVSRKDLTLGMVFLDGTIIRAYHKTAGAAKKGDTKHARKIVKLLAAHVEDLAPRSV